MQNLQDFTTNKSCPELSQQDSSDDSVYSSLITTQSQNTSCDLLQHALSFPLLSTLIARSGSSSLLLEEGGGGSRYHDSRNDPGLGSSNGAVHPDDIKFKTDLGIDRIDLESDFQDYDLEPNRERDRDRDLDLGAGGDAMTTTVEEETIEILSSCHVESVKSTPTPKMKPRSAPVSVKLIARLEDHDPTQVNRKRVVRAVGVVTFLLLLFSVVLIGISLNMSKSIDDMARNKDHHLQYNKNHQPHQNRQENHQNDTIPSPLKTSLPPPPLPSTTTVQPSSSPPSSSSSQPLPTSTSTPTLPPAV